MSTFVRPFVLLSGSRFIPAAAQVAAQLSASGFRVQPLLTPAAATVAAGLVFVAGDTELFSSAVQVALRTGCPVWVIAPAAPPWLSSVSWLPGWFCDLPAWRPVPVQPSL